MDEERRVIYYGDYLYHHGIKGQKHGVRRFQNEDGSWTEAGRARYGATGNSGKTVVSRLKDFKNRAINQGKKYNESVAEKRKQNRDTKDAKKSRWGRDIQSKSASQLSDQELDAKIQRARKEAEYARLQKQSREDNSGIIAKAGKKFATEFMMGVANKAASKLSDFVTDKAVDIVDRKLGTKTDVNENTDFSQLSDRQISKADKRQESINKIQKALGLKQDDNGGNAKGKNKKDKGNSNSNNSSDDSDDNTNSHVKSDQDLSTMTDKQIERSKRRLQNESDVRGLIDKQKAAEKKSAEEIESKAQELKRENARNIRNEARKAKNTSKNGMQKVNYLISQNNKAIDQVVKEVTEAETAKAERKGSFKNSVKQILRGSNLGGMNMQAFMAELNKND